MHPYNQSEPKKRRSVLVVDDEQMNRETVAKMIEDAGYDAVTAKDGEDALHLVWSHAVEPFDLIITDVHMPKIDGVEFVKALQAAHMRLPVIFMSASLGDQGQYSRMHLEPLSPYYLPKPIDHVPAFRAMITGILGTTSPDEQV